MTDVANDSDTVREFLLPDLGEGLTEAEITAWLVEVGEAVAVDQPVAEVETAKAVVEVPAPFAGVVVARHADVGEELEVGRPLVSIDTDPDVAENEQADEHAARDAERPAPSEHHDESSGQDDDASGSVLVGYGTAGEGRRRRRRPAATTAPAAHGPVGRPLAKPPVRKLAKDLGVDLADVTPTGAGGTITRDDVRAAAAEPSARAARPASVGADADERIPLRGVRRAIAERMTVSRREIPEATAWVDCDATALLEARDVLNASQPDVAVSPLALVLRICVAGLRRFPQLNASLDSDAGAIVRHRAVHLGFAAHTDRGLLVPVISDAQDRSTLDLATELSALAARAREATLSPEELSGSTFCVTNYGTFGVDGGAPVINHPNAAILGVGRISQRPWVRNGELAVRSVVQLSLAFDHRICDGGEAAGFLRFVADCVERPALLLGHV